MNSMEIIILENPEDQAWDQLKELFVRMYGSMQAQGLLLPLDKDGADKWLGTAKNTAGKFSRTIIARSGDKSIGFVHGMIRFLPDYLGGYPAGVITHIFIEDPYRKAGTGRELIQKLEEWFLLKNVHSVELQVITGNPDAMDFWRSLGFEEELRQYRKIY